MCGWKSYVIIFLMCLVSISGRTQTVTTKQIDASPGWSQTSVNATIFRRNSIVSYKQHQYMAYYDSTATVVLAKRKLGSADWEIKRTPYTGNVLDAHNVISIMIDASGYLHMAWDHHGHPLNYCKSVAAESLVMGEKQNMIGQNETHVTYPEFYSLPSGNLLFVYRDGASGNGNMVMNRYNFKTQQWSRIQNNLIDGEGKRNAYWQLFVSAKGTIHLSWVWRETSNVESNHDLAYARSGDEGNTWQSSTGQRYTLPIREASAECLARIPQKSDLINQTSMTADEDDRPYIATYYRAANDKAPQYYVHYKKKNKWVVSQVGMRKTDFSLSGVGSRSIPVSRPQLLYDKVTDNLLLIYRDEDYNGKALLAMGSRNKMQWQVRELTDYSLDRWEPSYDTELWRESNKLHVFVQKVGQGSGETAVAITPQRAAVLEVSMN